MRKIVKCEKCVNKNHLRLLKINALSYGHLFVVNKDRPDIKKSTGQRSGFLSREEKKWIADHGPIRIGYLNDDAGVGVMDPATGELTGVIKDYVELAKDCLQGRLWNLT